MKSKSSNSLNAITRPTMALMLSVVLIPTAQIDLYAQAPAAAYVELNAEQLDQLVAPIALDPDSLVASILTGLHLPGPGWHRERLAGPEHESASRSARFRGQRAALGSGRQSPHRVSLRPRQSCEKHRLDIAARQRLFQPTWRRSERGPGHAAAGAAGARYGFDAARDRGGWRRGHHHDRACQSGGGLRSLLQSVGCLGRVCFAPYPGFVAVCLRSGVVRGRWTCLRRRHPGWRLWRLRLGFRRLGRRPGAAGRAVWRQHLHFEQHDGDQSRQFWRP